MMQHCSLHPIIASLPSVTLNEFANIPILISKTNKVEERKFVFTAAVLSGFSNLILEIFHKPKLCVHKRFWRILTPPPTRHKKFLQVGEIKKFHRKKCVKNNFIAV